jgi:hypothetical protein
LARPCLIGSFSREVDELVATGQPRSGQQVGP